MHYTEQDVTQLWSHKVHFYKQLIKLVVKIILQQVEHFKMRKMFGLYQPAQTDTVQYFNPFPNDKF